MSPAETNYLLALKICLQSFNDATTVLILNKMPRANTLKRNQTGPKTIEECENEVKQRIFKELECNKLANVVSIPNDADDDELKITAEEIWYMAIKSDEINKRMLKTWTEHLAFYHGVVDGKVSARDSFNYRQAVLIEQRSKNEADIRYYQDRIHDAGPTCCDTWWNRTFNTKWRNAGINVNNWNADIARHRQEISEINKKLDGMNNEPKPTEYEIDDAKNQLTKMQNIFGIKLNTAE